MTTSDLSSEPRPDACMPRVPDHPERVRLVLVSECAAAHPSDNYGASEHSLFDTTTLEAFAAAGLHAASVADLAELGVHLTVTLRYPKPAGRVTSAMVAAAVPDLEDELAQFVNARAYLLAGDVAISAINQIARTRHGTRAIPAGSTYRIRGGDFRLGDIKLFPSYLQAGPAWYIEASKREMIAEDISEALEVCGLRGT